MYKEYAASLRDFAFPCTFIPSTGSRRGVARNGRCRALEINPDDAATYGIQNREIGFGLDA